jgi:hypothetical protein
LRAPRRRRRARDIPCQNNRLSTPPAMLFLRITPPIDGLDRRAAKSFMAGHLIVFFSKLLFHLGETNQKFSFSTNDLEEKKFTECPVCANYKVVKREFGYLHTTAIVERAQEKLSDSHSATGPRVTNQNSSSYSLGEESLNARC